MYCTFLSDTRCYSLLCCPVCPGEEELYTQEVGVVAAPVFSAHAQHTVVLPPGQSVAECLLCVDDAGEEEALRFEVRYKAR